MWRIVAVGVFAVAALLMLILIVAVVLALLGIWAYTPDESGFPVPRAMPF